MGHIVLQFPTWDGDNYFTNEIIIFILVFVAIIVGILLCFWGYKYFQTIAVILCGCLSGYLGIILTDYLTNQPIIKMFFFIIFTFFGCCFFYFVTVLLDVFFKMIHIKKALTGKMYIITSICGAGVTSCLLFTRIYNGWVICLAVFAVLTIGGSLYQKKKEKERPDFHCYEDIYRMKPLEEKEDVHA